MLRSSLLIFNTIQVILKVFRNFADVIVSSALVGTLRIKRKTENMFIWYLLKDILFQFSIILFVWFLILRNKENHIWVRTKCLFYLFSEIQYRSVMVSFFHNFK